MRFTSTARPSLTPLGQRLLHLSESKLANLESPLGGRDQAATLWKGVVISEAVRSAWRSVDQGVSGDLTNWHSSGAMALDVIGEDEEDENADDTWFETIISDLGEDDYHLDEPQQEWTETSVVSVAEDIDYDDEITEAYTISSTSPVHAPISFIIPTIDTGFTSSQVEVVEVDEEPIEETESVCSDCDEDCECLQPPQPIIAPLAVPLTPMPSPSGTPVSPLYLADDLDDCVDDFMLPPPLHRSYSSDSTASLDDEDVCVTPPSYSCEELEEEAPMVYSKGYDATRGAFGDNWFGLGIDIGA